MTGSLQRRGQPAIAMAALVAGWIGLRGVMLAAGPTIETTLQSAPEMLTYAETRTVSGASVPRSNRSSDAVAAAVVIRTDPLPKLSPANAEAGSWQPLILPPVPIAQPLQVAPQGLRLPLWTRPPPKRVPRVPLAAFRVVAGHQLLYTAAFAALSPSFGPVQMPERQPRGRAADRSRWSFDGWLLWRDDAQLAPPPAFGNSSYGASQTGLVLRYRLDPRSAREPMLFVRGTRPLARLHTNELAAGMQMQPFPKLPLRAVVEARLGRSGGQDRVRLAAGVISALDPVELPGGLRADPYLQAGYVGGANRTAFVDGQLRIDRRIGQLGATELRLGGGAWGGAQAGATRLDLGPGITVRVPIGKASARVSADWRARVAGRAAPGSGLAITLAVGI